MPLFHIANGELMRLPMLQLAQWVTAAALSVAAILLSLPHS